MFSKLTRRRSSRDRSKSKERRGSDDGQTRVTRSQSLNFNIVDQDKNYEVIFGEEGPTISNELSWKRRRSWSRDKTKNKLQGQLSLGFGCNKVLIESAQPTVIHPGQLHIDIIKPLHTAVAEPSPVLASPIRGSFVSPKISGSLPVTISPHENGMTVTKNVVCKPQGRYGSRVKYESKTTTRGIHGARVISPKEKKVTSQVSAGTWFPYSGKTSKKTQGTRSRGQKSPKFDQCQKSPSRRSKRLVSPRHNSSDSQGTESKSSNSLLCTKLKPKSISSRTQNRGLFKQNSGKLKNTINQGNIYVSTPPKSSKIRNTATTLTKKTSVKKPKPEATINESDSSISLKHKPTKFVPYRTPSSTKSRMRHRSKATRRTPSKSRKQKMHENLMQKCRIAKPVNRDALRKRRAKKRAQDL